MMYRPVEVRELFKVKTLYTLYRFHREKGYRFEGESHDFWEIIYVERGAARGMNGTVPYFLQKGQVIFHKPNDFHNFLIEEAGNDCDITVISFNGELDRLNEFDDLIFTLSLEEERLFQRMIEEGLNAYGKPLGSNLIWTREEPGRQEDVPGAIQMIASLLEELLISLYRKHRNSSEDILSADDLVLTEEQRLVRDVIRYLHESIYDNITFTDVSERFDINGTKLKKTFRLVTGYSVMQYYRKCIVSRIEFHIREGRYNIGELSDLFHFSSTYYFSRFYKRETGVAPSVYLKSLNDSEENKDILFPH